MGEGDFALATIYEVVKLRYPELCDDAYLCSTNCKSGHNHPEWRHRVRAALDFLKSKPDSGISKVEQRQFWSIGLRHSMIEEEYFTEGREVLVLHLRKERNKRAVLRKKQAAMRSGSLACEACGFDFEVKYGALGKGFAECHHLAPMAELKAESKIKLSDLAIVCANCHRMLHRKRDMTVEGLRSLTLKTATTPSHSRG